MGPDLMQQFFVVQLFKLARSCVSGPAHGPGRIRRSCLACGKYFHAASLP
jgi:hypothetical protein